jgi:hypothetical protein
VVTLVTGRPLPNFEAYLAKLLAYAKACEIKVIYRDEPCDGVYQPSRRTIIIDKDLPESTEIATLLHELGHAEDDAFLDEFTLARLEKLYRKVYRVKLSKRDLAQVLECERRAWQFGRAIAKKLRIPLGKWFEAEEDEALTAYARG